MTGPIQPFPDFNSDLLDQVRSALRKTGRLLPTTDEEIDQALSTIDTEREEIEASLSNPRKLFRTGKSTSGTEVPEFPTQKHSPDQDEIEDSLAVAAREGEEIPPEIREKMDRDRKEAEQDQGSPEESSTEEPSSDENTEEGQ